MGKKIGKIKQTFNDAVEIGRALPSLAIWAGWPPMLAAPLLVFLTANFVHVPFEEAKMRRRFGPAYEAYAGRVRRWV